MLEDRFEVLEGGHEGFQSIKSTCLALYGPGLSSRVPMMRMLDRVLEWFERFGCRPFDLGSDVLHGYKVFSFSRMVKRFRESANRASFLQIHSIPAGAVNRETGGDDGCFWLQGNAIVLGFRSAYLSERGLELLDFAQEFHSVLGPVYGILYDVPLMYGSTGYGIGLGWGNVGRSVQDWREVIRFQLFRFLRNVYRWNLLTDIQLDARVGDTRLEEWIRRDARHGELSPFAEGMMLWTVKDDYIPELRRELDEAGMFYGYDSHLYPIIQKYRCSEEAAAEYLRTGREPIYTPRDPSQPPLDMEAVLRNLGVGEGGQEVLRVEESGKLHKLTPEEIRKIASENQNGRKKRRK